MPAHVIIPIDLLERAIALGWSAERLAAEVGLVVDPSAEVVVISPVEVQAPPHRGRPRAHPPDTGRRLFEAVLEGESLLGAARRLGVPSATAKRLAPEYARLNGLDWPPGKSVGQRCYEAYQRLRSWDQVAAEVLPDSTSARPGPMAMETAKRWATRLDPETGQARAEWPVPV